MMRSSDGDGLESPGRRMIDTLPERLAAGRRLRAILDAAGAELAEVEHSIEVLLRARWPWECDPAALDRLAELVAVRRAAGEGDRALRRRLRTTVRSVLEGPGGAQSLRRMVATALGPGAEVEESPVRGRRVAAMTAMGDEIEVENRGLGEAPCSVSVLLRHDALGLKVSVVGAGDWVRLEGPARGGSHFRFDSRGGAWLNGEPCAERVVRSRRFVLPRGRSRISVSESRGRFDHSRFDEAVVSSPGSGLADVEVSWEERMPATVRISLPAGQVSGGSASALQSEVARAVAQVRSAGISVLMDLREEIAEGGSAGSEPSMTVMGGFAAAEVGRMSDRVSAGAGLGLEEEGTAGSSDEGVPAGRFGEGRFDGRESRFV